LVGTLLEVYCFYPKPSRIIGRVSLLVSLNVLPFRSFHFSPHHRARLVILLSDFLGGLNSLPECFFGLAVFSFFGFVPFLYFVGTSVLATAVVFFLFFTVFSPSRLPTTLLFSSESVHLLWSPQPAFALLLEESVLPFPLIGTPGFPLDPGCWLLLSFDVWFDEFLEGNVCKSCSPPRSIPLFEDTFSSPSFFCDQIL